MEISDCDVLDRVGAGGEEFGEIGGRDGQRGGVDVGMKRQPGGGLEVAVEHHTDDVLAIVDCVQR